MTVDYYAFKISANFCYKLTHYMLIFALLCVIAFSQSNNYKILTGMQQTNETFMAYIPYLQQCNYTSPYISPGYITTLQTTPENLFTYYKNAEQIAFWSSIENGLNIFLNKEELLQNYDGIIYRPEIFNEDENNISLNSTNDIVPLFNTFDNGNLTIYFVEVYVEKGNNFTLNQTIVQEYDLNLSNGVKNIIQNCNSTVNPGQKIVISQLDNTHYIGTCLLTSNIFFFTLNATSPNDTFIELTSQNGSIIIEKMILNPILEIFGVSEIGWNVFLLANNSQQTYSCNFDSLTPENFTCLNSSELSQEFLSLIEKLWSEENSLLQIKLEKLMTHIGPNATEKFPGRINSIFIDSDDNIYIQSELAGISYLSIYDWQKTQVLNISFAGKALLYNGLQFLVKTTESVDDFSIMSVTLPMVSFGINDVVNNNFNITLQCSDGVQNLEVSYDLFLSNIDYPSSYTFQTAQPELYSALSIYTFELRDYYTVFGPGYTVYFKGPDVLEATLLDASIITMSTYVISIVEIIVNQAAANTIFKTSSITYTTDNSVFLYTGDKDSHTKVLSNPCGISFELKGININQKETLYYGYLTDKKTNLLYCLCMPNINCQEVDKISARKKIMKTSNKLSEKIEKLSNLGLMENKEKFIHQEFDQNTSSFINNRLFTIVDSQLLVTLFNNGSAVLSNFFTTQFYDITTINCINAIVGSIFVKEFYDPILYLFCEQSGYIYQYKIRSYKIVFQRVIPLYGFKTRADSATNLLVGNSYVFVEVDVDEDSNISSTINVNPLNIYCCVLRIDPFVDTVSTIREVIFAENVQQIYESAGIDVAYYKGSQVTEDDSFMKIYLGSAWMALNLTQPESSVESFSFDIVFASINYNLASQFSVNITYNMTTMNLVENRQPIGSTIYLSDVFESSLPESHSTTIYFDYSGIQGPILQSNISSSNETEIIEDVELNDLIVHRNILGTIGNDYLQILTPMHGKSGTTFDQSIIVVGERMIHVFLKNYNNQEMYLVETFNLKYTDCQYFPYDVINSTTIQFVSECMFPELNNSQIPILNMSLLIDNESRPTLIPNLYLGSIKVNVSRLTNLKTIVFSNQTYILGINQGPMESLTGKLQYCDDEGFCSALYISSKEEFLLSYDVFYFGEEEFIIVTLDFQSVQVWVNPDSPNQVTNQSILQSTYSINLSDYLNDNISVITLTSANSTSFSAVLSGALAYYETIYFYGQQLEILSVYQRYGNCEEFDRLPVSVLLDNNNRIQALIAECNQNENILRLQTYERINSTEVVIFTGYLQYYTQYGPLSYLGNSEISAYNPIKILKLSNTMIYKLFLLYQNDKDQIKLVYQQIDGILADNYVYLQPSLQVTLSPLTTNIYYPTLSFFIYNDCYEINYLITTKPAPLDQLTPTEMAFLIIFIVCNVFNVIVLVFFYIYKKQKEPKKVQENESFGRTWTEDFEPHISSLKEFKDKFKERISGISVFSRKETQTRKETEIELFTTRPK